MNKIEQQVMAGVAAVYVARKLVSRTALECYALFVSSFCLTLFVSLSSVEHNFFAVERGGLPSVYTYIIDALIHTSLLVQGVLTVGAVALFLVLVDLARALRSTVQPKFA